MATNSKVAFEIFVRLVTTKELQDKPQDLEWDAKLAFGAEEMFRKEWAIRLGLSEEKE